MPPSVSVELNFRILAIVGAAVEGAAVGRGVGEPGVNVGFAVGE